MQNIGLLLWVFTKVNLLVYGGGAALIPLLQVECVERCLWFSAEEFDQLYAVSNALPGPVATKMAGYIGFRVGGVFGAAAALAGTVLPGALALIVLYGLFCRFREHPMLRGLLFVTGPLAIALLAFMIVKLWPQAMLNWGAWLVAVAAFIMLCFFKWNQGLVVGGVLAAGLLFGRFLI